MTMCSMCGEGMQTPYSRYKLPPEFADALDGGEVIDPGDVVGRVWVNLCEEHAEDFAAGLDRGENPFAECDASRVRYSRAEVTAAELGESVDDLREDDRDLADEMLRDALMTLNVVQSGDGEHLTDSEVRSAQGVVKAAQVIRADASGEEGDT